MKRYINAAASLNSDLLLASNHNWFELFSVSGIGRNDTPWSAFEVRSNGPAEKHVVEVRLIRQSENFNGEAITYTYSNVEVAHGMRMYGDTFEETQEYIDVLKEALDFAYQVKDFLADNGLLV